MKLIKSFSVLAVSSLALMACNHNFEHIGIHEDTRWEFAPNMYHSEAYEPMTQVVDSTNYPQSYNSGPGNGGMNLRVPPANTVKRGAALPYRVHKDSLAWAAVNVKSPFQVNEGLINDGEELYKRFCSHCHGDGGAGDGPVNEKYKGVASLVNESAKAFTEGHIFHVITHGKGRMWAHAAQLDQDERWKIAHFIKEKLQKQQ